MYVQRVLGWRQWRGSCSDDKDGVRDAGSESELSRGLMVSAMTRARYTEIYTEYTSRHQSTLRGVTSSAQGS